MAKRYILLFSTFLALTGAAHAEPASRDKLILLFKLMASSEECEFPLASKEATAVSNAAISAIADLHLAQEEADKVFDDTRKRMDDEGWDKLCDRAGPWAATWRETVSALAK